MSNDFTVEYWTKSNGAVVADVQAVGAYPPINELLKESKDMRLEAGKWSHVAVVRDGDSIVKYVNGNPYVDGIRVVKTKRGMYQIIDEVGKRLTYPTEDSLTVALARIRVLTPDIKINDERET